MAVKKNPKNNFFPLIVIFAFLILIIVGFLFANSGKFSLSSDSSSSASCVDGQTRYCSISGCSGVAKCINGAFRGCEWEKICTPNERVPCTIEGCAYAYRTCNSCGNGYGACLPFNES